MAFINSRLPARIAAGFRSGPEWNTRIIQLANGNEVRNKNWSYARRRYTANYGAFNATDRETLLGIYEAVGGRYNQFRFRDAIDFRASGEQISVNTGTTDAAQLILTRSFGSSSQIRRIQAIDADNFSMTKDGSPFTAFTLDDETGLVTPDANWEVATYAWTGYFDVWVRFNSDWLAFTAHARDVWTTDMELIEVPR